MSLVQKCKKKKTLTWSQEKDWVLIVAWGVVHVNVSVAVVSEEQWVRGAQRTDPILHLGIILNHPQIL